MPALIGARAALLRSSKLRSPYIGPVATGGGLLVDSFTSSNTQTMSRKYIVFKENISQAQVIIPNFGCNSNNGETGPGAAASVTCTIESFDGTVILARATFSGSITGFVPNNGLLVSDFFPITATKGMKAFLRIWRSCSSGINYTGTYPPTAGEGMTYGTSIADATGSTGLVGSGTTGTGTIWSHAAIVGVTQQPSVYLLGDSRTYGRGDTADASGDLGEIARTIGPTLPYINGGISGQITGFARQAAPNQLALSKYCTHIICELGINDFIVYNRTLAQLLDDLTNGIYPTFGAGGKPVFQTTITPAVNTTDNYASIAAQTDRTSGKRAAFNDLVRSGLTGVAGYFDVASAVENTLDGVWKVNGSANYATVDGVHESPAGYQLIKAAGVINPALFT